MMETTDETLKEIFEEIEKEIKGLEKEGGHHAFIYETHLIDISEQLKLSDKTLICCYKLLKKLKEKNMVSGRSPIGVISAIVYIGCMVTGENVGQETLSKVTGASEATIYNNRMTIFKYALKQVLGGYMSKLNLERRRELESKLIQILLINEGEK